MPLSIALIGAGAMGRHFITVARGEVAPLIGVEDASRTLSLIDAVERAAATGRAVTPTLPWEA